jgi:pilus assembly protein CpaF
MSALTTPANERKSPATPEYHQIKFAVHNKLLERINLEALSLIAPERARHDVRAAVARLVDEERTPLSQIEKKRWLKKFWTRSLAWDRWNRFCRTRPCRTFW